MCMSVVVTMLSSHGVGYCIRGKETATMLKAHSCRKLRLLHARSLSYTKASTLLQPTNNGALVIQVNGLFEPKKPSEVIDRYSPIIECLVNTFTDLHSPMPAPQIQFMGPRSNIAT